MAKRFTEDAALIADYKCGMSWEELQEKYHCSVTTVYDVLRRNDIDRKRRYERTWSVEKQELFKQMYISNCTYPEIRAKFGIASSHVTWWAHKLNLPMRGSGRNNQYENKFAIRNPENDYWLGYFFADGHLTYGNSKRRNYSVVLYSEKQYVVDKFSDWFGNGVRIYTKSYTTKKGTVKTMYQAQIGSKDIAQWFFDELKVTSNKHHTLNPNIDLTWDIVRGYFDGDGCMSSERYLSFKSCSKEWLERIHDFLLSYGIESSIKLSYQDCYGLFVYTLENLEKMLKYMYANPYYCHEYKHTNLVNRVAAMRRRKSGELLEA
ncbi:MAG: hypothetical protein II661_04220 [Bacteroidales bacterium]|nr:hypothetical protein [Bacteroidales bacterium]